MSLRSFSLDDRFVAQMDKNYLSDDKIDGSRGIRRATKLNQCITCFCRPKFHKPHRLHLKRHKYESIYFYGAAIVFTYSVTMICISLYYHYKHEYYLLQFHQFNQTRREFSLEYANKIELYLKNKISTTRGELINAGAPLISLVHIYPFAVICFYLNWLGYGLFSYAFFVFFFRYVTPVETLYFFRAVQNPRQNQHWTNLVIKEQVNRVLESSRVHALALINARLDLLNLNKLTQTSGRLDDESIQDYVKDYERNGSLLRRLTLAGKLNPISRDPDWLDRLGLYYCLLTYTIYLVIFFTGPVIVGYYLAELDFMGGLVLLATIGLNLIFSGSGVFYLSAIVMTLIDLIRSVGHIQKRVNECSFTVNSERLRVIHRHEYFGFLYSCYGRQQTIDETLLLTLMEYKIFHAHLAEFKSILRYMTPLCYLITLFVPSIARIHLAYLRIADVRRLAILTSLIALFSGDLFIIGTCYLQSRCARLRVALSSLQAHISRRQLQTDHSECYQHTILLLRYEYVHQDGHLTASSDFNYRTALRLHFWFSLILISIIYGNLDKASSCLLSDPFNLKRLQHRHVL